MSDFIKENGGIITLLGIAALGIAGYIEWRISSNVESTLDSQGVVTVSRMQQAEKDIADLEKHDEKLDDKIDKIVDILLED